MPIAVLLSGGVDSSVALRRLQAAGQEELTAFYLKIWLEDELAFLGECPWEEDLAFAREVCAQAGVPLEVLPMQREYHQRIVGYALDELRAGRTPSSDVLCNQQIKFGAFVDAIGPQFEAVASGHYARVEAGSGACRLLCSPDPVKDQTYFLSRLSQAQLARCRFPLGALTKAEVRRLAVQYELANRQRPDSQGICFLGRIPFPEFVRHHLGEQPGEILELETGRRLGEHRGHWFYTVGQRKGLGLSGGPWYVVHKEVAGNAIYVSHRDAQAAAGSSRFDVTSLHWIAGPPDLDRPLRVKLRHGPHSLPCRLAATTSSGRLQVHLDGRDPGIAAGQFAVFYHGEECLGSGVMEVAVPWAQPCEEVS